MARTDQAGSDGEVASLGNQDDAPHGAAVAESRGCNRWCDSDQAVTHGHGIRRHRWHNANPHRPHRGSVGIRRCYRGAGPSGDLPPAPPGEGNADGEGVPHYVEAELVAASGRARNFNLGGVTHKARAGIELALWDIKAKALGVPVYELFGGPLRDRIPLYWAHCGTTRAMHVADARARRRCAPMTTSPRSARRSWRVDVEIPGSSGRPGNLASLLSSRRRGCRQPSRESRGWPSTG